MDVPLGSAESEEFNELERLQRRAYGRGADIAGDAAAQARLSELEAAQGRQLTPVVHSGASVPTPVPEGVPVHEPVEGRRSASTSVPQPIDGGFTEQPKPAGGSVTEQDRVEGAAAHSRRIDGAPAAPWWRRRRFVILGGAIAALALNVALVAWLAQLIAQGSTPIPTDTSTTKLPPLPNGQGYGTYEPAPDYVLELKSVGADADKPNDKHGTLDALGISPDELRRYEDFQGLNVWSGESRYGVTCLLVAVPVQGLREGLSGEGCSLGGHDTIADVQPMRNEGLIRFVLKGDNFNINVYLYESGADPNASRGLPSGP